MNILTELYLTFAKIGLFTFGGGYAMLPLLEREVVDNKNWASREEILDYYAISQSTPGIIAVNTATFCGFSQADNIGGIIASLGFITPSIIIIILIANFLRPLVILHGFSTPLLAYEWVFLPWFFIRF